MVLDNQYVIDSIRQGDHVVLRKIYKETQREFHQWAFSHYQLSNSDTQEVFQNTIIVFYEKVNTEGFVLSSQWKTYLFAIGKNKIREYLRSVGRTSSWQESLDGETHDFVLEEEDDTVDLQSELVIKCIEELGKPCKDLITAFYYHKLALEEISPKLGYKNPNSAKNQKFKCMQRLKDLFLKEYKTLS